MNIASQTPHKIDISNTARESRAAVSQCVKELPFTQACTRELDPSAELVWIDRALPVKCFYLQRLGANRRTYQRANRFFGMDSVLTKCSLSRSMESLDTLRLHLKGSTKGVENKEQSSTAKVVINSESAQVAEKKDIIDDQFMPRSWCFPRDCHLFEINHDQNMKTDKVWYIAKPDRGRCGRGIALFSSREEVLTSFRAGELCEKDFATETATTSKLDPVIVQEYIHDPLLFEDTGCKFDLRIYVLIKTLTPLTVYVLDEGLVRVASTKYEPPSKSNCMTATMHLTNSHINSTVKGMNSTINLVNNSPLKSEEKEEKKEKKEEEQMKVETQETKEEPILKHCMTTTLLKISKQNNIPIEELWNRICESVSTAILAVYPSASLIHSTCFAPNRHEHYNRCFQLLGVDVLLDKNLTPWILEINNSPSLNLSTEADIAIKVPLIKSLLAKVFEKEEKYNVTSTDESISSPTDQWDNSQFIPQFQPLDVSTIICGVDDNDKVPVIDVQNRILDVYRRICGWKPTSARPVKSTFPSKVIWQKLISSGLPLPEDQQMKEISIDIFTQWVAKQMETSSSPSSILSVLDMVEEAMP